jgi:hypothetical protein
VTDRLKATAAGVIAAALCATISIAAALPHVWPGTVLAFVTAFCIATAASRRWPQ